jgi:predicted hydrolase (HD superfamily)
MLTRFELTVMLRVQLGQRTTLRRVMLSAAVTEGLAEQLGQPAEPFVMAALGAGLDLEMCAHNPARLGEVAAERLLIEGASPELVAAVRGWRQAPLAVLGPAALALVVADALAARILAACAEGDAMAEL